jgi:arylformamidase
LAICEIHLSSSASLAKGTTAIALIPEGKPGPYPVLYLLHGLWDDYTGLTRRTNIDRYVEGLPLIVIMPSGDRGFYTDSPILPAAQYETYLTRDLIAFVDTAFNTITDRRGRAIDRLPVETESLRGTALLFHTGWDAHWRTDQYFENHPHLTGELAEQLVAAGVTLVGIDSFNIDSTDDGMRPVHSALLGAGIPIVEHMRGLAAVPERGARFFAVPVKVKGMGTFPVRAFAKL